MRIALVCHRYYPFLGGIETHVKEIGERLATHGFNVEVLTTTPKGYLPAEQVLNAVTVRRFTCWAPNNAYYFSRDLKKYLARNASNYPLVHAHNYQAFPALYSAQTKKENKFIFTPHYQGGASTFARTLLHIPYSFVASKIFERADRVVCVSNYEKSSILSTFKFDESKAVVIPNGIDTREFAQLPGVVRGSDILYVGRLEEYKGVDYIVKALPYLNPKIRLIIVGAGPFRKRLDQLIGDLKVNERVVLLGELPREELLKEYARAGIFVLLSKREAYGITVAEALAAGAPCIVARGTALEEWIDDERCHGIEYPIDNKKLAKLIEDAIGKQITKPSIPDWDNVTLKLIDLYDEVTK